MFFDAAIVSAHTGPPPDAPHDTVLHVTFADWVPGICSIIGLLVVNLVNKAHLRGDGDSSAYSSSESSVVWKARLFLFLGFAFMAGGLAGSVVRVLSSFIGSSGMLTGSSIDCSGPKVHHHRVSCVPILRDRQRSSKRRHHADRYHTMDLWHNGGKRIRLPVDPVIHVTVSR